jgi:hypothetical protein
MMDRGNREAPENASVYLGLARITLDYFGLPRIVAIKSESIGCAAERFQRLPRGNFNFPNRRLRRRAEKRGERTPEMRVTSTTVQQTNVCGVIVHVLRKNVLYNGYNIPKTGMME